MIKKSEYRNVYIRKYVCIWVITVILKNENHYQYFDMFGVVGLRVVYSSISKSYFI